TWWLRGYLLFAAVQGFGIGLTGLLVPAEIQIPIMMTPLNARFVGSLYVAGGIGVLLAALAKRRAEARLFIVGFGFATALLLIVPVPHGSDFMAAPLPHSPVWIFDYVVDPVLALGLIPPFGLWPPKRAKHHPLSALLWVQAAIFGVL